MADNLMGELREVNRPELGGQNELPLGGQKELPCCVIKNLAMADNLMAELKEVNRSVVNRSVVGEIFCECDRISPLHAAIKQGLSKDILKMLIKNGADVNENFNNGCHLLITASLRYNCMNRELDYCSTFELFLDFGANVNGDNAVNSPLIAFVTLSSIDLRTEVFTPILQKLLQYANQSTKTLALHYMLDFTSTRLSIPTIPQGRLNRMLDNVIQAVKELLESGAEPEEGMEAYFKDSVQLISDLFSEKKSLFIASLFKIYAPYFGVKYSFGNNNDMIRSAKHNYVISDALKDRDIMELYNLISKQRSGGVGVVPSKCFSTISSYLSQEEKFNYLLALIP